MMELDERLLHEHYARIVRLIEGMILQRVPRLPFVNRCPVGLTEAEVEAIAAEFVACHTVAARPAPGYTIHNCGPGCATCRGTGE